MNSIPIARILGVSLALTGLILPLAGQAGGRHHGHKASKHAATKSIHKLAHRAVNPVAQLSPLDKMALAHAARTAALARNAKTVHKLEEQDGEEEREKEAKAKGGITGGEDYMWHIRAWPNGFIDSRAFGRAIAQRERLPKANIGNAGAEQRGGRRSMSIESLFPSATWSYVGPVNWYPTSQQAYYGTQSMNGHLESIVVDPTNRLILWVASVTGGVFKSVDGGVHWTSVSGSWLYLRTNTLAIDPKNHLTVYAGPGTSPTGVGATIGLMKTTDGGVTWKNIGANTDANGNPLYFAGQNVTRVTVDASNSNIITVLIGDTQIGSTNIHSATSNIWVSTDGGNTWTAKVSQFPAGNGQVYTDMGQWEDVAQSVGGATYLAVGTGPYGTAFNNLVYASTNHGSTWAQLPNAPVAPSVSTLPNGARIAASPTNANTFYLNYSYSDHLALYKTTNGGSTWTDISTSSGINKMFPALATELDQVPYDYYLACTSVKVNNVATDVLYLGLKSVFLQVQNAANQSAATAVWTNVGNAFGPQATFHSDQHCIAFDPTTPGRGWFGSDGGIYQFYTNPTNNPTYTTTFVSLNDSLQTTQLYNTAFHPTDPTIMLGGAQDNGTAGALGDLNNWQMPTGGDTPNVLINPVNPQNMYATYVSGKVRRTDDMFTSGFYDISPDTSSAGCGTIAFVTPLAMDPTSPNLIYTAGQMLGQYNATTNSWTYSTTPLTTLGSYYGHASIIAISPIAGTSTPTSSGRIFVATDDGKLLTTPDSGTTWVTLKTGQATDALPVNNVGAILPDPSNVNAVYVGISGVMVNHLFYCPDVTAATPVWNNLSGAAPATSLPDAALDTIALDPATANTIYVGTDVGIFQSQDGGQTWANATAPLGLPNVQVNDLKAMPMQGFLYAGTWGRGIWRIRIRNNDPLSGILFNPETVLGGKTVTGTVLLGSVAAADTIVTLTSNNAAATVPPTVTVSAGTSQANFNITTTTVPATVAATITASIGTGTGQTKSAVLSVTSGVVLPFMNTFTIATYGSGVGYGYQYGAFSFTGVVTINNPATTNTTVNLTSSDPVGGAIPATVVIPAGQTSAQFSIAMNPVAAPETITITAQLGAVKRTVQIIRN